jgi:putative heme-binding domain-containing protein
MSIKIGIIGAGGMAAHHTTGFRQAGAEIVALADVNALAAEKAAAKYGIGRAFGDVAEMLRTVPELDAVSIIVPNKEVSDQYQQVIIVLKKGDPVVGRIVNLNGDNLNVMVNMYDPNDLRSVDRSQIKETRVSKVSPMPESLLNLLQEDEILDLMAYLLSGGDRGNRMFARQ